jgi:hypothetical protein
MKRIRTTVLEQVRFWAAFGIAVAVGLVVAVSCNPVIMVAPPGSSIVGIWANPDFVPAHGGVSEIAVLIMEQTGVPVSDGTVVQFFTNLGRVEEQGRTNDGVARVKFVSDSRSGRAQITAFSGGGAPPPAPTATGTATTAPTPSGSATAPPAPAPTGGGGGFASNTIPVLVGNPNAFQVFLTADPIRITRSRSTVLTATAMDAAGNPAANVPVFFRITKPENPGNERLDSAGQPIFTDNNGQARDFLRTIAIDDGVSYPVTVQARTANGVLSNELVISIN